MEGRRAPTFIKISFVLPKFGESVVLLLLAVCVHFGLLVMTTLDNCHELQNAACTVHTAPRYVALGMKTNPTSIPTTKRETKLQEKTKDFGLSSASWGKRLMTLMALIFGAVLGHTVYQNG